MTEVKDGGHIRIVGAIAGIGSGESMICPIFTEDSA